MTSFDDPTNKKNKKELFKHIASSHASRDKEFNQALREAANQQGFNQALREASNRQDFNQALREAYKQQSIDHATPLDEDKLSGFNKKLKRLHESATMHELKKSREGKQKTDRRNLEQGFNHSMNLISNQKGFNQAVRIAAQRLNSREGKQKIDRRDLEQALAPALFNGKEHAVVINELKNAPKTAEGVFAKHLNADNLVEFNTKLNRLYESIAMHNLTDTNIKFFVEDFYQQVSLVTNEEKEANDIPSQLQLIPDHLIELSKALKDDAHSIIKITGLDEPVFVGSTGVGQHLASLRLASSNGESIQWQVGFRKCANDSVDTPMVTSTDVRVNGKEVSDWLHENNVPEDFIDEGHSTIERLLQNVSVLLVTISDTPDINKELGLSPQLAQMLIDELL